MKMLITQDKVLFDDGDSIIDIEDELHNYLWQPVELENVTLLRLVQLIKPLVDFWRALLNENIEPVIAEIEQSPPEKKSEISDEEIDHLIIRWICEEHQGYLDICLDVSAFLKNGEIASVGFTPTYELRDLPVKIDEKFVKYDEEGERYELGNVAPKLIELYHAIFYELCFFGSPEERDRAYIDCMESLKEFEKKFKEKMSKIDG